MTRTNSISRTHPSRANRARHAGVALVAAGAVLIATVTLGVSGASTSLVTSAQVKGFSGALVNDASKTLYALSVEKGGKIKCRGSCLSIWPPLLVKSSVTKVSLGAGVKGTIGFVSRSKTTKQVTFNSYPLYTYSGDSGARQSNGEGIALDGGTWYLVHAAASSAAATLFHRASTSSTTTTSGGYY